MAVDQIPLSTFIRSSMHDIINQDVVVSPLDHH